MSQVSIIWGYTTVFFFFSSIVYHCHHTMLLLWYGPLVSLPELVKLLKNTQEGWRRGQERVTGGKGEGERERNKKGSYFRLLLYSTTKLNIAPSRYVQSNYALTQCLRQTNVNTSSTQHVLYMMLTCLWLSVDLEKTIKKTITWCFFLLFFPRLAFAHLCGGGATRGNLNVCSRVRRNTVWTLNQRYDDDDDDYYHRGQHASAPKAPSNGHSRQREHYYKVVRPAGYGNTTSCGANELRALLLVLG